MVERCRQKYDFQILVRDTPRPCSRSCRVDSWDSRRLAVEISRNPRRRASRVHWTVRIAERGCGPVPCTFVEEKPRAGNRRNPLWYHGVADVVVNVKIVIGSITPYSILSVRAYDNDNNAPSARWLDTRACRYTTCGRIQDSDENSVRVTGKYAPRRGGAARAIIVRV